MIRFLTLISLLLTLDSCAKKNNMKDELSFVLRFSATSLDPLRFDKLENQIVTSSVNATLVSNLGSSGIQPLIANSWSNANDFKTWVIELDENKKYSNGEKLEPEDVLLNLKRYIFSQKQSLSTSGLLDKLEGYSDLDTSKIQNINEINLKGLKLKKNRLTFNFIKSMPNFLDQISFGIYGISHPTSFKENGEWIEKKDYITTGRYKVDKWDINEIIISLTEDRIDNFKKIKFLIGFNEENLKKSDMAYASKNSLAFNDDWYYLSRVKDSNITYIKVMRWNVPGDYWNSRENRINFRNKYYEYLEKNGFELSNSFFPVQIRGVQKISYDKYKGIIKKKKITIPPFFKSLKSSVNLNKKDFGEIYKKAIEDLCAENNMNLNYIDYPSKEEEEKEIYDFQFLGTGINIEDPYEDIRFMFMSKEGIRLPYLDKKTIEALKNSDFNIQKINQMIFDEGLVWPILFTSQGMWVNRDKQINFKNANLTKIAIDFYFVKKND